MLQKSKMPQLQGVQGWSCSGFTAIPY